MKNVCKGAFFRDQKGQTLLEFIVALGTGVVIIAAITVVVTSALSNATFSKNQSLAQQYAQQGMEFLRQMRNDNWPTFSTLASGSYCLDADMQYGDRNGTIQGCKRTTNTNPSAAGDNVPPFARQFDITHNDSSCAGSGVFFTKTVVKVSWIDGKCTTGDFCHNVTLTSCLAEPDLIPAP